MSTKTEGRMASGLADKDPRSLNARRQRECLCADEMFRDKVWKNMMLRAVRDSARAAERRECYGWRDEESRPLDEAKPLSTSVHVCKKHSLGDKWW